VKSGHVLKGPINLLQIVYWIEWLKGLFRMRDLSRLKIWVSVAMLQKNNKEGTHGQEPMNNFKMESLMQKHKLNGEEKVTFISQRKIF